MSRALLLLLLFASLSAPVMANKPISKGTTVAGTIHDAGSGEALSGVKVEIAGTDLFTYSDKDGNFSFAQIPNSAVCLSFQLVSFEKEVLVIENTADIHSELHVVMEER
jgi:hypothetical protein